MAFDILQGMGLTQQFDFILNTDRTYDWDTGDVGETDTTISFQGVLEEINIEQETGTDASDMLENPRVKAIIDKTELNGVDYSRFDSFITDAISYSIVEFVDNQYSLEITGVQE